MSSLADVIAKLGDFGPVAMREIEHELALAHRARLYTNRNRINWALAFPWLKERLCEAQNHRCCWCGKRMDCAGPQDDQPTFDHVVPLSKDDEDSPLNLVIACYRCNHQRGDDDAPA
jgi:5-methylcytosine-specific restriction endonuclease McrA